jgi:hypothetical protein
MMWFDLGAVLGGSSSMHTGELMLQLQEACGEAYAAQPEDLRRGLEGAQLGPRV